MERQRKITGEDLYQPYIESKLCLNHLEPKTWDELSQQHQEPRDSQLFVKDPTKLLKLVPNSYNRELEFEDIRRAIEANMPPWREERPIRLYTGRGCMEMFQAAMKESLEKSDEIFGDYD